MCHKVYKWPGYKVISSNRPNPTQHWEILLSILNVSMNVWNSFCSEKTEGTRDKERRIKWVQEGMVCGRGGGEIAGGRWSEYNACNIIFFF